MAKKNKEKLGATAAIVVSEEPQPGTALVQGGHVIGEGDSTQGDYGDPVISEAQRAQFAEGKLVGLPMTVRRPNCLGEERVIVPVAPDDLRAGVEAARRLNRDLLGRFAARLSDAPVAPDRALLGAMVENGYLDVWFENYQRWHAAMLEEFLIGRSSGRRF